MKAKKALFYLLLCIVCGCGGPILALHQLYYDRDVVLDQRLFGRWDNEPNKDTMEFTSPEKEGKAYRLIYTSIDSESKKPIKGIFTVHLVKLGNKLFLDIFPEELPCGKFDDPNETKWFYNTIFIVPVHTFVVVDSIEPQLKLRLTDTDKVKKLFEKDPNAIKHEMVEDQLVLTADTAELQKFVLKYADNEDVFSEALILKKSEIKKPNIKIAEPPPAGKKN